MPHKPRQAPRFFPVQSSSGRRPKRGLEIKTGAEPLPFAWFLLEYTQDMTDTIQLFEIIVVNSIADIFKSRESSQFTHEQTVMRFYSDPKYFKYLSGNKKPAEAGLVGVMQISFSVYSFGQIPDQQGRCRIVQGWRVLEPSR